EATVATLLGGAAGRIALYDEQLAVGRILLGAVGELAGQRAAVQGALAADQLLGLAGRLARPRGVDGLADDPAGDLRVLLEVSAALKPTRWVPPSRVLMLLAKEKMFSA